MKKTILFVTTVFILAGMMAIAVKTNQAAGDTSDTSIQADTTESSETIASSSADSASTRTQSTVKKVQIYVDPALYDVTVESENDYVQVYQTVECSNVVGKVHRGSWADYVSETDTLIQIKTDDGLNGYIPKANGEISEVQVNDAPQSLSDFKIVLDAGHGGEDSGALSMDGTVMEKNLTLATVLTIGETLQDAGVQVNYTRTKDEYLALADIAAISLADAPDLFLSIHYDNYNYPNGNHGFTVYYYYPTYETTATKIATNLTAQIDLANNGARFGNYFVIREQYVPSILIELGYLNSDYDLSIITEEGYAEKVAASLLDTLKEIVAENQP